jgi:hypothetical protein
MNFAMKTLCQRRIDSIWLDGFSRGLACGMFGTSAFFIIFLWK